MNEHVILIAEDDPDDQLMLKDAFEESDPTAELEFVANGIEVLDFLKQGREKYPDLIILDLNMPKLDGRSLLNLLKADPKSRHLPVVILSTAKAEMEQANVVALGACEFFSKPSSFVELVQITTCILQKWLPTKSC